MRGTVQISRGIVAALGVVLGLASVSAGGFGDVERQTAPPAVDPALMTQGREAFGGECAECHNDAGNGMGPSFVSSAGLMSKERVITRILEGTTDGAMPAFAATMSDRDVAAVSTFIRNSFDNKYGGVTEADVKAIRDRLKKP